MCEPATLAMVASAAGTAMTAYGTIQQGKQAKAQSEYNARVSENNAIKARNRGTEEENRFRLQTDQLRKEQEAHFGAGNIQMDSGSASDILANTMDFGEADALNIRSNTDDEVDNYLADAAVTRSQGENALASSQVGAFSTLLTGAGQVASKWYTTRNTSPKFPVGLSTNTSRSFV